MKDNLLIRKAKPLKEEGLAYAQYVDEASEGFFKSVLGEQTYEIIADAYLKPNNEYSFETVSFIESKSKIVGGISGYTSLEKKGFQKKILSQFPNGSRSEIKKFNLIGKILSWFLGPKGEHDYYLQTIAINTEMRGKGLGQQLMKNSALVAKDKGSITLSLDVSSKNKIAINSYLKFGMEIESHWPNFLWLPHVFTRMTKSL